MNEPNDERLRRWRLVLGGGAADGIGVALGREEGRMDQALSALYDAERSGGLGGSNPNVARWLGDIREFFPTRVVQLIQHDAMQRLDLKRLMFEPEILEGLTPDIELVATLLSMKNLIPSKTKATARLVVRKLVEEIERKLANPLRQAIGGALNRSSRKRNPRHNEIDWIRTIRANLRHYQAELRTIIPETRIGFGRKTAALKDVVLCVDQSGSMAGSVVYSSIMGAVMASMRSLRTHMVVFDTAVVDLSAHLHDPVDLLFGTQLGGGTDIARAIGYCQTLVTRPNDTVMVLISDLIEGGSNATMLARAQELIVRGVKLVVLLALDDRGAPCFDPENARAFGELGAPAFACTPDAFPELMAAAISNRDMREWAASKGIAVKG